MAFRLREQNVERALRAIPGSTAKRERASFLGGCCDPECCDQHPGFDGEGGKLPFDFRPPKGMSNTKARKILVEAGILPPQE